MVNRQNFKDSQHQSNCLQNRVGDLEKVECETIETFDTKNNVYTPATMKCVLTLLQNNVGSSHSDSVIKCVMKLANKKASKLPRKSTVNNM